MDPGVISLDAKKLQNKSDPMSVGRAIPTKPPNLEGMGEVPAIRRGNCWRPAKNLAWKRKMTAKFFKWVFQNIPLNIFALNDDQNSVQILGGVCPCVREFKTEKEILGVITAYCLRPICQTLEQDS